MTHAEEFLPLSALSMAILLALVDGDRHGYALMQSIEEQTGGILTPGTGSLYAALQRLMADGLIEETPGGTGTDRRRRYYAITTLGRRTAQAEAGRLKHVLAVAKRKNVAPKAVSAAKRT